MQAVACALSIVWQSSQDAFVNCHKQAAHIGLCNFSITLQCHAVPGHASDHTLDARYACARMGMHCLIFYVYMA